MVTWTHPRVATVPDDPTADIGTDDWNAVHTSSMATAKLLGRTTAGAGAVEELISPTFRAYKNANQTGVVNLVYTKVVLQAESVDSHNWFVTGAGGTASRFTPLIPGKYLFSGLVTFGAVNIEDTVSIEALIYKNGALNINGHVYPGGLLMPIVFAQVIGLVDMNGTTDYVELFAWHDSAVNNKTITGTAGGLDTWFSGIWLGP
jgi:hypothetical protein